MLFLPFLLAFGLVTLTHADLPFLLGDIPIAVKAPYLHTWISNSLTAPGQAWPTLYTRDRSIGWDGIIRVDGQAYQWLGDSILHVNFSTTVARGITPTRTTFTIQAGPMKFNATFFSPIEPNDYTRQSIPFSYLFVNAFTADDGMPHTVQMYSDISCDWVGEELMQMTWGTQDSNNIIYHHFKPKKPLPMVDTAGHTDDGTAYYATAKRSNLTWQTGSDLDCRGTFVQKGSLNNSEDTNFRASNDHRPAAALAFDLGSITPNDQPDPIVWGVGVVRNPLVNYATPSGFQNRTGYYWSAYQNIDDVISQFLTDFPSARQRGQTFDDQILNAALGVSSEYAGIVALVTRQIFASMDITIPAREGGQPSASDVKIFMEDISMSARANPVEVIYAALPALLYFNASFAHDLLLPLLEFQSSSIYPNSYASPDLGTTYPTVNGNTSTTEELAIEHCGNMLIMAYAHAAKSGDGSLISKYHSLLQKWAEYLVQNSLHPNNAVSADDISYPNMSNLALKGILGVYSMGKIDEVVNPSNTTFKDKANELITKWKQSALTDTHIQAQYGKPGTWGLMYNLFPAVWLQTGLIDDDVLNREAQFYLKNAPPDGESYSLDNGQGNDVAYPHWALMTAAVIPPSLKPASDALIESTYAQAFNTTQTFPLPMRYRASTGQKLIGSKCSAAQGAVFGIMAMNMPNVAINITPGGGDANTSTGGNNDTGTDSQKDRSVGRIVGGVIGGLGLLLIITGAIFFWRRHEQQTRNVPGLGSRENPILRPFINRIVPVSAFQRSLESQHSKEQLSRHMQPPMPLAHKEREAIQSNELHPRQHSPPILADPHLASESRGGETLRAEVEDLRREVEAIRNIAELPPVYQ